MTIIIAVEKGTLLAMKAFNYLKDPRMYLRAGSQKTTFGTESNRLLSKLPEPERKKQVK